MAVQPTKQHILESTISAIEKHGLQRVTTRAIADEAGVNNAAIHYYFGTKEQLIGIVLKHTLSHTIGDAEEILAGGGDLDHRLTELFSYLIDGILRYPNLIRAHLQGPLMEGEDNSDFAHMMENWADLIGRERAGDASSKQAVGFAMHSALYTCIFAGLIPESAHSGLQLRPAGARSSFVEYLVRSVITSIGDDG